MRRKIHFKGLLIKITKKKLQELKPANIKRMHQQKTTPASQPTNERTNGLRYKCMKHDCAKIEIGQIHGLTPMIEIKSLAVLVKPFIKSYARAHKKSNHSTDTIRIYQITTTIVWEYNKYYNEINPEATIYLTVWPIGRSAGQLIARLIVNWKLITSFGDFV